MATSRILLFAVLVASAIGLIGCPGNGTHPAAAALPKAGAVASSDKTHDLVSTDGRPAARGTLRRESLLSSYSNPEEGIAFRYPRYYALEEGEIEEHSFFLKRQEDLDIERPGTRLVATVLIPEDGYPNTTFEHGSLQLVVNDSATAQTCGELSESGEQALTPLKSFALRDVLFRGTEWQYLTAGTQVLERHYTGFSNGQCYEFSLVVAADVASDPDGATKPADGTRIMRQLEKIVESVRFQEQRVVPTEELNADNANRL